MWRTVKRTLKWATLIVAAAGLVMLIGCVRTHGGVWYFKEAKLPADWPSLTPVGKVQVKQYPGYREAIVTTDDLDADVRQEHNTMFGPLFKHISENNIAMTAPVDLGYADHDAATDHDPAVQSMSFLYDIPDRGPTGPGVGPVTVRDVEPITVISIGVRGEYNDARMQRGLEELRGWLAANPAYRTAGPPRYLGYNSPFVPGFWRYGEVQWPIELIQPVEPVTPVTRSAP